jgi:predicted MFS family arabinose efflux permease
MSRTRPRLDPRGMTGQKAPAYPTERLVTAAFVRLGLADLAYFTAAGVAVYALPFYVTGPLGSDASGAGLAFGAFAFTALVLRPFAGRLSDTVGRRPLLLGGALLCAAAMLTTAVVQSLALVVVLRLVLGVAEAAFFVASFAAIADLAPASRLGEALSYGSLGLYLGLALGPPLAEFLVGTLGFTAAWSAAALLALLAAIVAGGMGETGTRRPATHPPAALIHRGALPVALGFLASVLAMGAFLAFAALRADAVGLASASLPLFVYGGIVVAGRIAFAKIPDRLPSVPLAAAALAVIALGLTVIAVWGTGAGLLTGAALLALGVTFSTPAFFSAAFATAAPAERGAVSGTVSAALDLGLGGGPILLGLLAGSAGLGWTFAAAAAGAVAGGAWTLALLRAGR